MSTGPGTQGKSFEDIKAQLQNLGMTSYELIGNAKVGFTFTAKFEDKQQPNVVKTREETGATEVAAMQAVLNQLPQKAP